MTSQNGQRGEGPSEQQVRQQVTQHLIGRSEGRRAGVAAEAAAVAVRYSAPSAPQERPTSDGPPSPDPGAFGLVRAAGDARRWAGCDRTDGEPKRRALIAGS